MNSDDVWLDKAPKAAAPDSAKPGPAQHVHRCTNLARFDLVSIRLAVLCADSGSLAVAARTANMSKSNASQRLSNLECGVRTRLFFRDHLGLHPTEAGSVFVAHARAILNEIERLDRQLASMTYREESGRAFAD